MSEIPAGSPIHRLNVDTLWYIIKMNASMFDDDTALETTLFTSQVCHEWRNFMLSMSTLWAHLVDLDHLYGRTAMLRLELFRRSGTALLWIKTRRCAIRGLTDHAHFMQYFLSVLGENWDRIQKLEANLSVRDVDPAKWTPLYLTAPYLQSLSLSIARPIDDPKLPLNMSLVGGSAPMLREFRFTGYKPSLSAPWLHKLHSMELDACLTVSPVLEILMLTKNLVNLRLGHTATGDTSLPLPYVALPKLTHLSVRLLVNPRPVEMILDHLQTPPSCSLNFSADKIGPQKIFDNDIMGPIIQSISICTRRHFTHCEPQRISFGCSPSHFTLQDHTHPGEPAFGCSLKRTDRSVFPLHALALFLREFTLPHFSKVTELKFAFTAMDHPIPELAAFLACLPSIQIIETDEQALQHLVCTQKAFEAADAGSRIAFPALKTLKLHSFLASFLNATSNPVSEFVMARFAHGHAIDILDLTRHALDVLPDMACLEEASVLWQQSGASETLEYVCGTW